MEDREDRRLQAILGRLPAGVKEEDDKPPAAENKGGL